VTVEPLSLFHPAAPNGHSAVLSPCRTYRYALERRWGSGPFVLFVGLNPSTADESVDDNTIRRCIGFAKTWGYGGLLMGNLFAFRATKPRDLRTAADPVGPDNDVWLTTLSLRAGLIVAAWGADPIVSSRVCDALDALGDEVQCLGTTKDGQPRHPLYLRKDTKPEPFGQRSAAA
jgi:hypothetical protein